MKHWHWKQKKITKVINCVSLCVTMVVWFSNVPDQEHVPYKQICVEPPIRDVYRYLRTSDYLQWLGFGAGIPFGIYLLGTFPSFDSTSRRASTPPTLYDFARDCSKVLRHNASTIGPTLICRNSSVLALLFLTPSCRYPSSTAILNIIDPI